MKKKLLVCKNDNYSGSSCPRCLIKQNFLDFPAYEFATEGVSSNCDTCGNELSWETIEIKKPLNFKLIGAIATGVILIGGLVFFFSGKSSDVKTDEITTPPVVETPVVEAPVATPTPAEPVTETVAPEAPAPKAVEEAKPATTKKAVTNVATPKGTQTKKFPGGGKYVGEMKNGEMQGLGTFYYGQRELISPRDMKKRYAEEGDYLIGEFYEGKVVSGKLYDASNTLKEVIMIGR